MWMINKDIAESFDILNIMSKSREEIKIMEIDFLGGALEVGGSSILLNIDNKNILMDAGIRQSSAKDNIPNFRAIQDYGGVDAIVISHAHLDHIGCLPIISKEYPEARIYMNNMTKDLLKVLLYDSLKIMNNRDGEIPLYAEIDVKNTLDRVFTINYEVRFSIFEDMYLTFYNAGHIAGAACVYIQSKEGALFYSGDFSVFSQRTVEGAKIPKLRPDVAIIESTYGDRLHSNREIEEKLLVNIVNECIEKQGKMIIPAFALGRAQEVIIILKNAMNKGSMKKVKIYVDGMVRDINRTYKNHPLYLRNSLGKKILKGNSPFYDDNIIEVKNTDNREEILSKNEPLIIISSSGMLTGGPSAFYAEKIASMENGYIVITGYQDEESPGRKILDLLEENEDSEKYLNINNLNILVKCKIKKVGLSAHADKNEIKGLIQRISARNICLVHGNEEVIKQLGKEISDEFIGRVFTPECGEKIKINIKNPRKQLSKNFPYRLNEKECLSTENIEKLWNYILLNYNDKLFTIEDLMYVWSSEKVFDEDNIRNFKNIIIDTVYFDNDIKRLFLFKARTKEEVNEELKPKELNQQKIIEIIENKFKDYNYKKISLMIDKKAVILNFDFPQAVPEAIITVIEEFKDETGWDIGINEKLNLNEAEILIKSLVDPTSINKISFYPEKYTVNVLMDENYNYDLEILNIFKEKTAWDIKINEQGSNNIYSNALEEEKLFFEAKDYAELEQNAALNIIDIAFSNEKHKPYKKSIKSNYKGKYIELAFISPSIGEKFTEKLCHLCNETGWSIAISDKVNQNEIINTTKILCSKYNIQLKKNPSFNISDKSLKINITNGEENFDVLKKEVEEITGVKCIMI